MRYFRILALIALLALASAGYAQQGGNVYDPTGNAPLAGSSGITFSKIGNGYQATVPAAPPAPPVSGSGALGDVVAGGPNGTLGGTAANGFSINGNYTVTSPQFGAVAGAVAPVRHTVTTNGTTTVVLDAPDSDMANKESLMAFGAGAACNIGGTACSSITAPTPTATVNGYTGANAGASTTYGYEIAACDANYGCTAASAASTGAVAATVLTEPGGAGSVGNNLLVSWAAVTGAVHYVVWRTTNGGSTWSYWLVVDTNSFTDWYNHQSVNASTNAQSGPFSNTPLAAVQNDTYVGQIVSGAGTVNLVMNSIPAQLGSGFVAFRDDTPAIQAAITAAAVRGGKVTLPPGQYKVRSLNQATGVNIEGAWAGGSALASVLNGTSGYDVISFPTPVANNSYLNFTISGGRSAFTNPLGGATYQYLDNLLLLPEFAGISLPSYIEEWYIRNLYFSGGQYGIYLDGPTHYIQKSSFLNTTFNTQLVNAIRINSTVQVTGYLSFMRMIVQGAKQSSIWTNQGITSVTIDGYSDEGIGSDWVRTTTVPGSNTVTCTSGSNVINVANTTGFAVGQDATVYGCGTNGLPLEGTICAVSANVSITLQDPTCTTAVNAGTTQASSQTLTNAIYDNMYLAGSSSSNNRLIGSSLANTGGCCGGTQTRYQVWTPNGGWSIESPVQTVRDDSGSENIRYATSLLRGSITTVGFSPGLFVLPNTPDSSKTGNFATINAPTGGDFNFGLLDTVGNGSGTWGQALRMRRPDANRTSMWSVENNFGNVTDRGHYIHTGAAAGNTNPSVNSCYTSPGAVSGNDTLGSVPSGTGTVTGTCTINFGQTWATAPKCFCQDNTTVAATCKATASTTILTMNPNSTNAASDVLQWKCESN